MVETRTKNSKRSIISGLIKQVANLVLTFFIRTLVIYFLGAEYQGLNGLFTSILQVLSLADLGFSTAVMFILYKPIANNDKSLICAIVNYLKKIYLIVGLVILSAGLGVLPFLRFLISGDIPTQINLYLLFIIYLVNSVVSYLMFAYKSTLLSAMQLENVVSNVYTISFTAVKLLQVLLLVLFGFCLKDFLSQNKHIVYYIFLIILPLGSVANNIIIQLESKRLFPDIVPKGKIDSETKGIFKKQIIPIFIGKISDVARNSFDNIVISIFFGLTLVAVYDNYYYIFGALYGIMGIIIRGMIASVGNSIVSESVEKNYNDLLKFDFIFMGITGWCTICMYCLYQPFMFLWMKGDESMMMSELNMTLFCVYFYAINMTYPRSMYLDGKGLFYECRYWCIIEAVANLCLNFLLGKLLGITGIIIATIVTIICFNFFGRSNVLFRHYFQKGERRFYLKHLIYFIAMTATALITRTICELLPNFGIWTLFINLSLCCVVFILMYILLFHRSRQFKESMELFKRLLLKR